jgi:hypothetical protein
MKEYFKMYLRFPSQFQKFSETLVEMGLGNFNVRLNSSVNDFGIKRECEINLYAFERVSNKPVFIRISDNIDVCDYENFSIELDIDYGDHEECFRNVSPCDIRELLKNFALENEVIDFEI